MPKKTTSKAAPPRVSRGPEQDADLCTLSVRFTEDQRDLLARAAEMRGWTPTALLRSAALEKAAHILNTCRVTKFDFSGLASDIARRLFEPVQHVPTDEDQLDPPEGSKPYVTVPAMPLETLFRCKKAAQLGGAEFFNLIIQFAEGLRASERGDLPDPIDPTKTDS